MHSPAQHAGLHALHERQDDRGIVVRGGGDGLEALGAFHLAEFLRDPPDVLVLMLGDHAQSTQRLLRGAGQHVRARVDEGSGELARARRCRQSCW